MKKIIILKDVINPGSSFLIDVIASRWSRMGHEVNTHYGPHDFPEADVAILHVDQTQVPERYFECLAYYPVALNRNVLDISKKNISSSIVQRADKISGPVIVKTNANFGGLPEFNLKHLTGSNPAELTAMRTSWATTDVLDPNNYPIYKDIESVPLGVWDNSNLIVERFLPEMENGLFYLRYYVFLGDKGWASRFGSKTPIVKFGTMVTADEPIPVPDELIELRRKLGFDYGRFDYVEHQGKTTLLDTNKTLGGAHHVDEYAAQLDLLASGINDYF